MTRVNRAALAVAGISAIAASVSARAAEVEPGLPQLDPSTWPSQLFWLVIVFGGGYIFMSRVVTPRIGSVLEERKTRIEGDLAHARTAAQKAQKAREDYESSLEKARSEAAEHAREATNQARLAAEKAEAKSAEKTARMISEAEGELAKARKQAEGNMTAVAAEIAIEVAAKVAGVKVTASQASKAVDECARSMKRETGR